MKTKTVTKPTFVLLASIVRQIVNRPSGNCRESQVDNLEYRGIPDPGKGR